MAGRGCVLYGIVGHNDSQYSGPSYIGSSARGSAQYEGCVGELYIEPCGLHSDQWLGAGSVRNAPGVCHRDLTLYPRIVLVRDLK